MSRRNARGRHARPAEPRRTPAPAPRIEVPAELRPQDGWEFPTVILPAIRPHTLPSELRAALADDDTRPLDMRAVLGGEVVDDTPRPARHEGLAPAAVAPIPVPASPFLNAGAQQPPAPDPDPVPDLPIPPDPPRTPPHGPSVRGAVRRSPRHALVFTDFDSRFYAQLHATLARAHEAANIAARAADAAQCSLLAQLARTEAAHQRLIDQVAGEAYRGQLAEAIAPMPLRRRIPGAALAALEAGWEAER